MSCKMKLWGKGKEALNEVVHKLGYIEFVISDYFYLIKARQWD